MLMAFDNLGKYSLIDAYLLTVPSPAPAPARGQSVGISVQNPD